MQTESHKEHMYRHDVLLGNWFESRLSGVLDKKAITPGIFVISSCMKDKTIYRDNYAPPLQKDRRKGIEDFCDLRQDAFRNRLRGNESNIKMYDADKYMTNMTTIYDIFYRIKPKQAGNVGVVNILKKKKSKEDLQLSYGNATETGLINWNKCEAIKNKNFRLDKSQYKQEFPLKELPVKVPKSKCVRKTSIMGAE